MKHTFKLTGDLEGKDVVLLDKYAFVNGEFVTESDADAAAYASILCVYYACTHEFEAPAQPAEPANPDASLSKDVTKGAAKASTDSK